MMLSLLRRFRKSTRGAAAIEFAFLAPMLLLIGGGIFEYGRLYQVNDAANRLAGQYALALADCSDAPAGQCQTEANQLGSAYTASNIAPVLAVNSLTVRLFQLQMAGTTPNIVYRYPAGASLTSAETTLARARLSNGQSGVLVTVSYTHTVQVFGASILPMPASALSSSFSVAQLKG